MRALTLLTFVLTTSLLLAAALPAQATDNPGYAEGQFYTRMDNPAPPPNPGKITVQEFFWYGCPHCFHLDPILNKWIKTLPADVVFEHVPDNLGNPLGKLHEKAFYTATALGIEHKIHTPLFRAIHVQHQQLRSKEALRDFFVQIAGISPDQFNNAWSSFGVDHNIRRADKLAKDYRIMAVPALVINGEYELQGGLPGYAAMGGSEGSHFHKMLKVADALIAKLQKQQPQSTR
ncbi:MAG: thiol:disulfide interchange protein DsbA/DsbL [Sinobacteraceae bacterium]|nr:thiol:disulfide interchange protein DsbA/DsbL [Nevskiaceae bacterium]